MRRTIFAIALTLGGCAAEPSPGPVAPSSPATQAREQERIQAQTQAQIAASVAQSAAAVQAAQAQALAMQEANAKALGDANADANARIRAQQEARVKAAAEACEKTRAERAADAQGWARSYAAYVARVAPQTKTIGANCKLTLTDTGAVRVDSNSGGARAYREQKQGVACRGGVPKGVTEADVYNYLMSVADPSFMREDPIASASKHDADNRTCAEGDRALGLDTQVAFKDTDGIKKLLAWKPATP